MYAVTYIVCKPCIMHMHTHTLPLAHPTARPSETWPSISSTSGFAGHQSLRKSVAREFRQLCVFTLSVMYHMYIRVPSMSPLFAISILEIGTRRPIRRVLNLTCVCHLRCNELTRPLSEDPLIKNLMQDIKSITY